LSLKFTDRAYYKSDFE